MKKSLILIFLFACMFSLHAQYKYKGFIKEKAYIAGKNEGTISRDEILNASELVLEDSVKNKYKIISFKMTIVVPGKNIIEIANSSGGKINDAMKDALKDATSSTKV